MRDAIVIGGGIAGMSAAWRLRHSDVLVLEGSNRIGGRLRSERRGAYWLNWGGHVFGGEGSFADKLLKEVGVDALNLQGSFAALAYKGKVLNDGNVNFYPFRLPISWSARWEIVKAGIKVKLSFHVQISLFRLIISYISIYYLKQFIQRSPGKAPCIPLFSGYYAGYPCKVAF